MKPRSVAAPSDGPGDASERAARVPPTTGLADFLHLAGRLVTALVRSPRGCSLRLTFREWVRRMMARHGSDNLLINFGIRKLLWVGGPDLSMRILDPPPSTAGFATGKLKREAMGVLAPVALTVSDDAQWTRLRPFNEAVLHAGQPHELRQAFLAQIHVAFRVPPVTVHDVQDRMRRAMVGVVFGDGAAPPQLVDDLQALADLVQRPGKRLLLAPLARRRRARLYRLLRQAWQARAGSTEPSLLGLGHRLAGDLPEDQLLQQVPHWMFTFTGSGTDLLVRTLALVTSHPDVLEAARREIAAAGPLDRAEAIDGLQFLGACLLEAARLYPPVTRTSHCAPAGATAGAVRIPPGTEILHSFPLLGDEAAPSPEVAGFRPKVRSGSPGAADFDPFLHGARHCPGRELILFVCTSALAILLGPRRLVVDPPLSPGGLPPEFPRHGIRFKPS